MLPIHFDDTRTRCAQEDHIYLIVDVLLNAAHRLETHRVCVEIAARPEDRDHAHPPVKRRGDFA
jgi:hypothetical protein